MSSTYNWFKFVCGSFCSEKLSIDSLTLFHSNELIHVFVDTPKKIFVTLFVPKTQRDRLKIRVTTDKQQVRERLRHGVVDQKETRCKRKNMTTPTEIDPIKLMSIAVTCIIFSLRLQHS